MEARLRLCALALTGMTLTGTALAAEPAPLSAIDWLSDSIATDPDTPISPLEDPPTATQPGAVTVMPLDAAVADSTGLIPASRIGLDPGLWGRSSAADLSSALAKLPDMTKAPPSLKRFAAELMQARLDPPIDAMMDESFFLARIDALLAKGHLDAADAMITRAGFKQPDRFRRAFDIALLKGTETDACRIVEDTPDLSPTYPTRIFCLARLGQWDVAALTLGNAESLGILSDDEDQLLLHFLDPELMEGKPLPTAPRVPTPIQFRLFEAVGERISTEGLPVAYAVADLSALVGWKARLRAAERLTAVEAMSFEDLLAVYAEETAAASGAPWDRVRAIVELRAALDAGDADRVARILPEAWHAALEVGYQSSLAMWMVPQIEGLDLEGAARQIAFDLALYAGVWEQASAFASASEADQFLLALARGDRTLPPPGDALGAAVLRGLAAAGSDRAYRALIEDDRAGEALFRAMGQLTDGAAGNPNATAASLGLLKTLGLEALARQIAVELVLMEGAA